MPKLTLKGTNKDEKPVHINIAGICLAILGKVDAKVEYLQSRLEDKCVASLETLTYHNMNVCGTDFNKDDVEVLTKLMGLMPFMRTCITKPKSLLDGDYPVFDIANYPLNEIMYAIFHLRVLLEYQYNGRDNRFFDIVSRLKDKYPLWAIYLAGVSNRLTGFDKEDYCYHLCGIDACCYRFDKITWGGWSVFMRGELTKKHVTWDEGDTLFENITEGNVYKQTMRKFLTNVSTRPSRKLSNVMFEAHKLYRVNREESTDLFGQPMQQESTETCPYEQSVIAIMKAVEKLELSTEGFIE